MPQDRLALAVLRLDSFLSLKALSLALNSLWTSPVSHSLRLAWNDDAFHGGHIIDALRDVRGHSVCVFLNVCVVVVSGCLLRHFPVCCVKAVLKSRGGPLWPHSCLVLNQFVWLNYYERESMERYIFWSRLNCAMNLTYVVCVFKKIIFHAKKTTI